MLKWNSKSMHIFPCKNERMYSPSQKGLQLDLTFHLFQYEAERLATIERDNRILLERMAYIMRTSGLVDHIKHDYESKR